VAQAVPCPDLLHYYPCYQLLLVLLLLVLLLLVLLLLALLLLLGLLLPCRLLVLLQVLERTWTAAAKDSQRQHGRQAQYRCAVSKLACCCCLLRRCCVRHQNVVTSWHPDVSDTTASGRHNPKSAAASTSRSNPLQTSRHPHCCMLRVCCACAVRAHCIVLCCAVLCYAVLCFDAM
jgi:hypothetical protein